MIRSNFDDTHTKILDCGKKHFLKNGFEKASLRDICKDAGVTTGAFYRHFIDKNDLFEAIVSPIANKIIDNISNKGFHIINHSHFLALTEAVLHSENEDELIENAKLVSRFFSGGWKTIRGY